MNKNDDIVYLLLKEISLNNSEIAFEKLYLLYYDQLLSYSLCYVVNECDAEEIVSDTFFYIWQKRQELLDISNFNAYIYKVIRNKSISNFRKNRLTTVNLEDTPIDIFAHTDVTPEKDLISKEKVQEIQKAINQLPNRCKLCFKLVKEQKLKYRDAAHILNISIKTLESHITTALKKIRETLND